MTSLPPADLGYMEEVYRAAAKTLREAFEDAGAPGDPDPPSPELLIEASDGLLEVLRRADHPQESAGALNGPQDLQALGDYGIRLMSDLAHWAERLRLGPQREAFREAAFVLALWLARRGVELSALEPVVDTLAHIANRIRTPAELERVFAAATDILEAVNPAIAQDLDRSNPARPWRILILNRAIIATRSHQPLLMEQAYQTLVETLPEEAAPFFREGMEQMDALNYPPAVREVVQRYFQTWCSTGRLH
jgi:hypothetical protein